MVPTKEVPFIKEVRYPKEAELHGRAGAVRVVGPGVDILYVVVYVKPETSQGADKPSTSGYGIRWMSNW